MIKIASKWVKTEIESRKCLIIKNCLLLTLKFIQINNITLLLIHNKHQD